LRKLDRQVAARIVKTLEDRVAPRDDPRTIGSALWLGIANMGRSPPLAMNVVRQGKGGPCGPPFLTLD